MRIVHVYKDFDPPVHGGMEGYIAQMCRYQRDWADVEALTCSRRLRSQIMDRNGTRVTEAGELGRIQSAPVSPMFPWYMRYARADIMVVHVPNPTAELGWLLSRPQGTLVVRYHSDVVRQAAAMRVYGPLQMQFLRKAAIILPTSEQYLGTSPVLQRVADRCRVVPLGIPTEAFAEPDWSRVQELQAEYGERFVFFCGRHRYYKGLRYLIEAAPRVQAPVVVAGDGPERSECERMAQKLNVNIAFPGVLSHEELVNHLHACSVVAFPSVARSEAFGMAILEAHACGKPVVATKLGTGVEFANLHEQTGLNVPPKDAVALADALNQLLTDEAMRARMGDVARKRVCESFDVAAVARREFEIYMELSQ